MKDPIRESIEICHTAEQLTEAMDPEDRSTQSFLLKNLEKASSALKGQWDWSSDDLADKADGAMEAASAAIDKAQKTIKGLR